MNYFSKTLVVFFATLSSSLLAKEQIWLKVPIEIHQIAKVEIKEKNGQIKVIKKPLRPVSFTLKIPEEDTIQNFYAQGWHLETSLDLVKDKDQSPQQAKIRINFSRQHGEEVLVDESLHHITVVSAVSKIEGAKNQYKITKNSQGQISSEHENSDFIFMVGEAPRLSQKH